MNKFTSVSPISTFVAIRLRTDNIINYNKPFLTQAAYFVCVKSVACSTGMALEWCILTLRAEVEPHRLTCVHIR